MNLIVIGGTGTVGSLVVERSRSRGHQVQVATRATGFDLAQPATWARAFAGAQRALYLTPRSVREPLEVGTAVFAALRTAGVERVVHLTGLGVDRAVGTPLERLERALEQSGLAFTHVRPNSFMQNFSLDPARRDIAERDELAAAAGDARISWVDARDLAEVCVAALLRDDLVGRGLDLTGPAALSHREVALALSRATGRTVQWLDLDEAATRERLLASGVPPERVAARLSFHTLARTGAFSAVSPHVEEVLGRPATPFETFAKDSAASWGRA